MAYQCPRCNRPVRRGSSPSGVSGGLFENLLCSAMGSFDCPQCGPIMQDEFPPEVQRKMAGGSIALIAVAATVVAIGVAVAIVFNYTP